MKLHHRDGAVIMSDPQMNLLGELETHCRNIISMISGNSIINVDQYASDLHFKYHIRGYLCKFTQFYIFLKYKVVLLWRDFFLHTGNFH